MQSAIGRVQLEKLSNWHKLRERNALILIETLKDLSNLRIPVPPDNLVHAWYKFHCYVVEDSLSSEWDRDRIINEINAQNYPAFSGSCSEIYLEKCFAKYQKSKKIFLKNASSLGKSSLMFLIHPTISLNEMKNYATVIKNVLKKALK